MGFSIAFSCVIVSSLFFFFFSSKNDCIATGHDFASLEIQKNLQDSVRFNCTTDSKSSVDWQYRKTSDSKGSNIFIGNARGGGGHKSDGYAYRNRYGIEMDIDLGRYDLLIDNVTKIDEGFYECSDASNPVSITIWKLSVTGGVEEDEEGLCSNGVTARVSGTVLLVFSTTKKDAIQLEHRSVDRTYPLHMFRDGRLVNDPYVQSGRFDFSASNSSWNLLIKDVQKSDAGSFICSEDNGLGRHYVKELIVINVDDVGCSTENETCGGDFNVTCKVTYAGNCPPLLRVWTEGQRIRPRQENRVLTGNSVSLMTVASRRHVSLCTVETQSTFINTTCRKPVCKETSTEPASSSDSISISIIPLITICLLLTVLASVVIIVYFVKKRRESSNRNGENAAVSEREQSDELL